LSKEDIIASYTQHYENARVYLSKQNQAVVRLSMQTGGWIEALYLACLAYEMQKSEELQERIGGQKVGLSMLLLALDVYQDQPGYAPLVQDLKALQGIYNDIAITTSNMGQQELVEQNGDLVYIDLTTSDVDIADKDIAQISKQIKMIRGKYIK